MPRYNGSGAWASAEAGDRVCGDARPDTTIAPSAATRRGNDYLSPRPTPPAPAKIRRWQPFKNAARIMRGYLSAELPSGMIVNDLKLMVGPAGKFWIATPSIKLAGKDGSPRLDANGKPNYSQIVEFANRAPPTSSATW